MTFVLIQINHISRLLLNIKTGYYFSAVKKDFPGAHIERARGTMEENVLYCYKDGNIKEFGECVASSDRDNIFKMVLSSLFFFNDKTGIYLNLLKGIQVSFLYFKYRSDT